MQFRGEVEGLRLSSRYFFQPTGNKFHGQLYFEALASHPLMSSFLGRSR